MASNADSTIHPTPAHHDTGHQGPHHEHHQPPPPEPHVNRRSSFSISVPTPDFMDAIAGGAHYAGGLPPTSPDPVDHDSAQHVKHRRPETLGPDNPVIQQVYRSVLSDLEEVTPDILRRRFRPDAVFEDPLCIAEGWDQYAAQWFALPKVISKSERVSTRIISGTLSPNRVIFEQTQVYTFRLIGLKKTIPSVVIVDLDEDFKITRLEDQWYGKPLPKRWGASFLRKVNAMVTPWIFSVPKRNV
ncbi:unnamed protein product [Somion occarium]|uniref:Uncharacterized protein n=1 Tax=Somion occarium TaxID=3059160 RepID=A0ABP1D891_9APHY